VDHEARRKKQQDLMAELLERKIRLHARHLYEQRGQVDGHALQDWVQAESEVLGNSIMAPFYRKVRANQTTESTNSTQLAGFESGQ
jgi:Protein of unknown function (DUF2934)